MEIGWFFFRFVEAQQIFDSQIVSHLQWMKICFGASDRMLSWQHVSLYQHLPQSQSCQLAISHIPIQLELTAIKVMHILCMVLLPCCLQHTYVKAYRVKVFTTFNALMLYASFLFQNFKSLNNSVNLMKQIFFLIIGIIWQWLQVHLHGLIRKMI